MSGYPVGTAASAARHAQQYGFAFDGRPFIRSTAQLLNPEQSSRATRERLRKQARKLATRVAFGCGRDAGGKVDVVALKLGIGRSLAARLLDVDGDTAITDTRIDSMPDAERTQVRTMEAMFDTMDTNALRAWVDETRSSQINTRKAA